MFQCVVTVSDVQLARLGEGGEGRKRIQEAVEGEGEGIGSLQEGKQGKEKGTVVVMDVIKEAKSGLQVTNNGRNGVGCR